jgi:hypothetical protein
MPINADDSIGRVVEARDEIGHCRFASAGWTDEGDQISRAGDKGDSFEATSRLERASQFRGSRMKRLFYPSLDD